MRRALHRALLRTSAGPLRAVWAAAYALAVRAAAAYLRRGRPDASAYLARSLSSGDAVYGLSDIDLIVVLPGEPGPPGAEHARLRSRWRRLIRRLPLIGELLMSDVAFYEDGELRAAVGGSVFTYGLDAAGPTGGAAFFGEAPPADDFGLRSRPGLLGPTGDWRLVAGRERRPPAPARDRQDLRIAAWLELQYWWSYAFGACADPDRPRTAHLCVKLAAEPARIWLALAHDERPPGREDVLRRAIPLLPEEQDALTTAITLQRALSRSPDPPLAELLPFLARMTSRIARRLEEEVADRGFTEVRLAWSGPGELALPNGERAHAGAAGGLPLLPLCDWRALAAPSLLDEAFTLVEADPGDPRALATLAGADREPYAVARTDRILVLPALGVWTRAFLRSVQCALTDPVSVALAAGGDRACFPDVRGWSAEHWARRAVAEHAAWLERPDPLDLPTAREWLDGRGGETPPPLRALAKLITAARAALFLDSIRAGDPELPLTAAATCERLAAASRAGRAVAAEAGEAYRASRAGRRPPSARTLSAFREAVVSLPAYREGAARSP